MTREEVGALALSHIDKTKHLILELITGYGKTKIAIDLLNHIATNKTVLVLVAKTVHKQTWANEIAKWGGVSANIIFECYESFKNYKNASIDVIVADEMQHLSLNRLAILRSIEYKKFIGLSATIKKDTKQYFASYGAEFIKCNLKEAVESLIIPEPTVYVLPLKLNNTDFVYKVSKFNRIVYMTQQGYYNDLSNLIDWYKAKYFNSRSLGVKNRWLSLAGKRLKWLSEQKEAKVLEILNYFKHYKTLTFCSGIEQSERLGKYNITSKNKNSSENLELFNSNKIKHITSCNMLNEGVNLVNCRIGIFCNLNSSEIITKQRIGRILRHRKPIVIIPYFLDTREEELMKTMISEYNPENVKIINSVQEIKL